MLAPALLHITLHICYSSYHKKNYSILEYSTTTPWKWLQQFTHMNKYTLTNLAALQITTKDFLDQTKWQANRVYIKVRYLVQKWKYLSRLEMSEPISFRSGLKWSEWNQGTPINLFSLIL